MEKANRDILVARHGDIDKVDDGIAHGQTQDPLNSDGKKDAKKIGREWDSLGVDHIISSDLKRGKETADIASKIAGANTTADPKLRTWDIGIYDGEKKKDVEKELDSHRKNPQKKVPEGETYGAFKKRVLEALREKASPGTAFVLHNEILKLLGHTMEPGETKKIRIPATGSIIK